MADKTTTLKTKTNDNVYPNVIGDNRKNAFVDSSTITHHFYDKTHKVGFQINNETNIKIQNSLQKPSGLTKTKLVGVGTNGQENIEIGDNLTLANGKLSATGGGSGGEQIGVITIGKWYTLDEWKAILEKGLISVGNSYAVNGGENIYTLPYIYEDENPYRGILHINELIGGVEFDGATGKVRIAVETKTFDIYKSKIYNHFITMADSTNNVVLYLTIQITVNTTLTADMLTGYLAGKKVLANGNLHGVVPTYIAGEGGVIKVYYMTPGDNNINPTPDEYQDLSSFTITDLVTSVE